MTQTTQFIQPQHGDLSALLEHHPETLLDALFDIAPVSDRFFTFYRSGGVEYISHANLIEQVERLAAALSESGVSAGDRIGVCAANGLEWVLLDLAALRLGAVSAGFNTGDFTPDAALAQRYGLTRLFADNGAAGTEPLHAVRKMAAADNANTPTRPVRGPSDTLAIKFTSGSTGAAKALAASYGSAGMSIAATQDIFAHGREDKLFVFLTLSLLQQRYWVYSALLFGCDLVISTPQLALHALRESSPTVLMGVPAFYETLRQMIEVEGGTRAAARTVTGGRIRYMWTGSAPIRSELLRFMEDDCGLPIYEGYGLNETCIATKNHPTAHRRGSAGRAVRGKQILIGADGIIRVRSRFPVNCRYDAAPEGASEKVFEGDDTVVTGDLGHLDADGFLWIQGRADDVVVLENAKNVAVRPIEEALRALPGVAQVILCGSGKPHLRAIVDIAPGYAPHIVLEAVRKLPATIPSHHIQHAIAACLPLTEANGLITSQGKPRRAAIIAAHQDLLNSLN
ncbi:long-chain acyl-CoA synthetase [Undibacterium sp. GrIS 1.2]